MTDKELRKLKRHEVLQLLLAQVREIEELQDEWTNLEGQAGDLESSLDRLQKKLTSKDKQYDKLHRRLENKDKQIGELRENIAFYREKHQTEVSESANIAEAALRLSHIADEAQEAAEQFLYNVKLMHGGEPDEDEMDLERLDKRLAEIDEEDRLEAEEEAARIAAEKERAEREAAEREAAEKERAEQEEAEREAAEKEAAGDANVSSQPEGRRRGGLLGKLRGGRKSESASAEPEAERPEPEAPAEEKEPAEAGPSSENPEPAETEKAPAEAEEQPAESEKEPAEAEQAPETEEHTSPEDTPGETQATQ